MNPNLLTDPINFSEGWTGTFTKIQCDGYRALKVGTRHDNTQDFFNCMPNKRYKWSFWAKADSAGDKLHTELYGGGGSADIALTTDWKRYSTTGTSSNKEVLFFWSVSGSPVYIRWPELIADE